MEEIRDLPLLDFWRHPAGTVGRSVGGIVAFAALLTLTIPSVGAHMVWDYYASSTGASPFWFRNGLAILVAAVIVLAALRRGRLSRGLRVAVALPVAHAIAMVVAWGCWAGLIVPPAETYRASLLIARLPIGAAVAAAALVVAGSAWLIAPRRRGELGHTLVMFALAGLLSLGLWLPIASELWCRFWMPGGVAWWLPRTLIAFVLVPPWVLAVAFTAFAVRRPSALPRIRPYLAAGLFGLFVFATICRFTRLEDRYLVFDNFVHVLLAVAFVAVASIVTLGAWTWLRGGRARRLTSGAALTGVVADDDDDSDVVAWVEITSWLRGPRAVLRPFTVTTAAGDVPIPGGAWIGPLSATTTQLHTGESVSALRRGDRVVVAGLVSRPAERDGAHPFRSAPVMIAGAGGISVAHARDERYGLANVAIALWRPCVAYLAILIAIGVPSVVTVCFAQ